jgi:8-oxo-dGTP pyrophosphatase MutT (NUDIX family)
VDAPGDTTPLEVDGVEVGALTGDWLARALEPPTPFEAVDGRLRLRSALASFAGRSAAFARWGEALRARDAVPGWRDERVVIRDERDGRPLCSVERALLRPLGLLLRSVQACVWTPTAAGPLLWVAVRAAHKPVDPGRLDALVAGGIAGFDDAASTLLRECAEEAGIPAVVARTATPAGTLELCHLGLDDGLQVVHRERVALHELALPPGFVPVAADGEHAAILTMTPDEALASIAAGRWTRDGAQATADLILRHGWAPVRPPDARG